MRLEGKKIIVTGGANGIGRCLVEMLLKEKAIIGVFDIDASGFETLRNELPGVFCVACDVADNTQVENAVAAFYNEYDAVDVLINNASLVKNSPLINVLGGMAKHDIALWDKIIASDLSSVFYTTVHVVEKMIRRRTKGVIVNVASVSSAGNAGQSAYSAAKAGVIALTGTWAKELNPLGIRVACISPGFTNTKGPLSTMTEKVVDDWKKAIPLKRMAEPSEIAAGIMFIIGNDYFNGKVLELDGGLKL